MGESRLVKRAREFAERKHSSIGHTRKYTGEPYTVHLKAVVRLVECVDHTQEMLAAAWLHDTLEDTETNSTEILDKFGFNIFSLVLMLTDVSKPEDGNRAFRKRMDREHFLKASNEAKTIKLADLIDNSQSIIKHDKKFAEVYMTEKVLLLGFLAGGDDSLYFKAWKIVEDFYAYKHIR